MSALAATVAEPAVLRLADGVTGALETLLARCGLELRRVPDGAPIPFSYWGESEAGIEGRRIYARGDTPVHSVLHEAAHVLCMDGERRTRLARDAGGDFDEENAVCCLQIVLAGTLPGVGAERLLEDMDRWGYTFRLGSARRWYAEEAAESRAWLLHHGLLDATGQPTFRARF